MAVTEQFHYSTLERGVGSSPTLVIFFFLFFFFFFLLFGAQQKYSRVSLGKRTINFN